MRKIGRQSGWHPQIQLFIWLAKQTSPSAVSRAAERTIESAATIDSIKSHVRTSMFSLAKKLLLDVDRKDSPNQLSSCVGLGTRSPNGHMVQEPSGLGHPHETLTDRASVQSSEPSVVVAAIAAHSLHVNASSRCITTRLSGKGKASPLSHSVHTLFMPLPRSLVLLLLGGVSGWRVALVVLLLPLLLGGVVTTGMAGHPHSSPTAVWTRRQSSEVSIMLWRKASSVSQFGGTPAPMVPKKSEAS